MVARNKSEAVFRPLLAEKMMHEAVIDFLLTGRLERSWRQFASPDTGGDRPPLKLGEMTVRIGSRKKEADDKQNY